MRNFLQQLKTSKFEIHFSLQEELRTEIPGIEFIFSLCTIKNSRTSDFSRRKTLMVILRVFCICFGCVRVHMVYINTSRFFSYYVEAEYSVVDCRSECFSLFDRLTLCNLIVLGVRGDSHSSRQPFSFYLVGNLRSK